MKKLLTRYNTLFLISMFLLLWSVYSFFSWHIQEIPKPPQEVIEKLKESGYNPVLLSSQLLDSMILEYPELNIFPGGGESYINATSPVDFILLEAFQSMDCEDLNSKLKTVTIFTKDGFSIKRCSLASSYISYVNVSSFIDKFKVTLPTSKTAIKFKRGRYKTGLLPWENIELKQGKFGKTRKLAISAHPLADQKVIRIEVPPINRQNTEAVIIGVGIANSGIKKNSTPVNFVATQRGNTFYISTKDGIWIEKPIPEFKARKPITVYIWTENPEKRHFFFSIMHRVVGKKW